MKTIKYIFILIFLLVMLLGCSQSEPITAEIHIQQDINKDVAAIDLPPTVTPTHSINNLVEEINSAKLLWFNTVSELLHEYNISGSTYIEEVHTANNSHTLLVHNILSTHLQLINYNTREVVNVDTPNIQDSLEGYYNDYGAQLMFPGWLHDPIEVAIFGNKFVMKYSEYGEAHNIFEASKPIYGTVLSPDMQLLALLIASDDFIGPEADLIVIDLEGKIVYENERVSYASHSDGFLFPYPIEWTNDNTIAVPILGHEDFHNGYALVNIDNNIVTEENPTLSEENFELLKQNFDSLHPRQIYNVIEKRTEEGASFIAIQTNTQKQQVWLLDLLEQKVTFISDGVLIGWNEYDELLILQRSSILPYYTKLNLNLQGD